MGYWIFEVKNIKSLKIKALSIEHYSGFHEDQSIKFAIPNGKDGSGLTLIMGENNSGKTSIVDIFMYLTNQKNNDFSKLIRNQAKFKLEYKDCFDKIIIQNASYDDKNNIIRINPKSEQIKCKFGMIGGRYFLEEEVKNKQLIDTFKKLQNKRLLKSFIELAKTLISGFKEFRLIEDQKLIVINNAGYEHDINHGGSGIKKIFSICSALLLKEQDILIIDEPETSLHPFAQKKLANLLTEESRDRQIILITHSPYFVDWNNFLNKASFVRTSLDKNSKCNITNLDCFDTELREHIHTTIKNWSKPHVLGLEANEFFFYSKILFCEGLYDVSLCKKYLKENFVNLNTQFEIFGFGVDGTGNIIKFLKMAKILKFSKVGLLTDKIINNDTIENWKKDNEEWCKDRFLHLSLPTEDIIDKPTKSIKGCFQDGKVKEEYKKPVKKIFENIVEHFT